MNIRMILCIVSLASACAASGGSDPFLEGGAGDGPGTHTVKGLGTEDARAAARRAGGSARNDYNAIPRCVRTL
jgi:hypothetical protein